MNNRNLTIMAGVLPALILLQSTPSIAQCAPNAAISLNFTNISPGGKLTVTGAGFSDCGNDTNLGTGVIVKPSPVRKIRIVFVQGKSRVRIGVVDANKSYEFSAPFDISTGAKPGPASIVAQWNGTGHLLETRPIEITVAGIP
jgi:hypothetical protein